MILITFCKSNSYLSIDFFLKLFILFSHNLFFLANKNPIGLVNHNVAGINNPCLVYVAKLVDSDALTKYKVVDDLAGFDRLQEIDDFEVAKIALVPYNKAKSFWSEVVKQERDFGRQYNSLNESFSQLFDYLKLII